MINKIYKKFWIVSIFFATILALNSISYAQDKVPKKRFHVFLSASTPEKIEKELFNALNRALIGLPHELVMFQADKPEDASVGIDQAFAHSPDGILFFLHNLNKNINIKTIINRANQQSTPMVFVGEGENFENIKQRFTAFGSHQKEVARQISIELRNADIQDALCVATVSEVSSEEFCKQLQEQFSGNMQLRKVNLSKFSSENWANIVSALTQNPKINHIVITDADSTKTVLGAVKLLKTPITYSVMNTRNALLEGTKNVPLFTSDPQWYLLSTLAIQTLMARVELGHELWINLSVLPRIIRP